MGLSAFKKEPISYDSNNTHKWASVIGGVPLTAIAVKEVPKVINNVYIGDFYGLLQYFNIPANLWTPHLLINGFLSNTDYKGETSIKVIQYEVLNKIYLNLSQKINRL